MVIKFGANGNVRYWRKAAIGQVGDERPLLTQNGLSDR